jgi:hypothetical protein
MDYTTKIVDYTMKLEDVIGKTFHKLKITNFSHTGKTGLKYFKCLCECGNFRISPISELNRGRTISCGCFKRKRKIKEKIIKLKKPEKGSVEWKEKIKIKFLKYIEIIPNSCWNWIGYKDREGYGICWHGYFNQRAHRTSFYLFKHVFPKEKFVLHICDNKSCVNPDHLYLGDAKQNAKDAIER